MSAERLTVTLPEEIVKQIDRLEKNRSRFVLVAVQHELERREREALRASLAAPHAESEQFRDDLSDWSELLPDDEASELVNLTGGRSLHWAPGRGWGKK